MATIDRDFVVREITELMLGSVMALELRDKQAGRDWQDSERNPAGMDKEDREMLTLMKVAQNLGIYDETVGGVRIPPYLLKWYWGEDHPKAQGRSRQR
jgi:hypothetical protein